MKRALPAMLLTLAACATTRAPAAPAQEAADEVPLPTRPSVLFSRLGADAALMRISEHLNARGFIYEAPLRKGPDPLAPFSRRLARTTTLVEPTPTAEPPGCWETVEVVQADVAPAETGSELRLACYTDALEKQGIGACLHHLSAGCPHAGDRLLGEIALDVSQSP